MTHRRPSFAFALPALLAVSACAAPRTVAAPDGGSLASYQSSTAPSNDPAATQDSSAPEAAAVAKELADPTNAIGKMGLNYDYVSFDGDLPGAGDQSSSVLLFQPSLPYPLESGDRLFARPAIPIVLDQPVFNGTGFDSEGVELGDIGYDFSYGGTLGDTGLIYLVGAAGTLPTATADGLGSDQWAIGPEALIGKLSEWGAIGILVSHQWDFAETSSSASTVNRSGGQYFYTYLLEDGWAIGAAPTFSYDWQASSDDALTLPLATGVSKTVVMGGTPWRFAVEGWWYVEQPDSFGPEWQLRFNVTPVVPLPW